MNIDKLFDHLKDQFSKCYPDVSLFNLTRIDFTIDFEEDKDGAKYVFNYQSQRDSCKRYNDSKVG